MRAANIPMRSADAAWRSLSGSGFLDISWSPGRQQHVQLHAAEGELGICPQQPRFPRPMLWTASLLVIFDHLDHLQALDPMPKALIPRFAL